jgi:hypothetical protein
MKTLQATAALTASARFTRIHWLLAIAGILTAITCVVVLLADVQPSQAGHAQSVLMYTPKSSISDQFAKVADVASLTIRAMY